MTTTQSGRTRRHAAAVGPDREPTEDEARDAEQQSIDDEVREHDHEMAERGARQEGEGRIP